MDKKRQHKVYERLGFGYLSLFRTMRFLVLIFITMCSIMLSAGIADARADTETVVGFTILDKLSIANLKYSS